MLKRLARLDVLLIDELGYLNLKPEQSNIFFKLMEERYRQHSTIITTNLVYDEWPNFLGSRPMVEALLSRLRHYCHTVTHRRSVAARSARLRSVMDDGRGQEEYIRQVLEAYRKTPGTMGTVRRPDRMLAAQLYQRGVSVSVIENAFVLAAARRLMRPADAPPLSTIRSLAYFLPVIEEVLDMRVSPELLPISPPQARTDRATAVGHHARLRRG